MALGAVAIFVVGLGSVVGLQAITGTSLWKGTSALQTGMSQVASNAGNTSGSPATDPPPSVKAVVPSTSPTEEAASHAEEGTASPTPTSKATPKQTAPAGKATAEPSPAAATSAPGSAAYGQADSGITVATTAPAAK